MDLNLEVMKIKLILCNKVRCKFWFLLDYLKFELDKFLYGIIEVKNFEWNRYCIICSRNIAQNDQNYYEQRKMKFPIYRIYLIDINTNLGNSMNFPRVILLSFLPTSCADWISFQSVNVDIYTHKEIRHLIIVLKVQQNIDPRKN